MPSNAAHIGMGHGGIYEHTKLWWIGLLGLSVNAFEWGYAFEAGKKAAQGCQVFS